MLDGLRILAVHHDAGLNGGTLLFQTVLEGLARDHGATISISVPRDGPIVARARALGPVHIEEAAPARRRLLRRLSRRPRRRVLRVRSSECDLIFANSVASLRRVEDMLSADGIPLAVYVHESKYLLERDRAAATRVLRRADLIFAVSPQVRATVGDLIGPTAPILVVRGFVPVHPARDDGPATSPASEAPGGDGSRIVGGMGTMTWHKGADLFLVVARRIRELMPGQDVRFVWVGDEWNPEDRRQLEHDLEAAGLEEVVSFPGRMDNPVGFLRSLSLFLLPSREDSWPLVMLEAAAEGVPIVCFRNAGGAEHFVAQGGGTAVPYLDVEAMSRAAVRYLSDPQLMERESRIAREIARATTPEEQIRTIATELAGLCAPRPAR